MMVAFNLNVKSLFPVEPPLKNQRLFGTFAICYDPERVVTALENNDNGDLVLCLNIIDYQNAGLSQGSKALCVKSNHCFTVISTGQYRKNSFVLPCLFYNK